MLVFMFALQKQMTPAAKVNKPIIRKSKIRSSKDERSVVELSEGVAFELKLVGSAVNSTKQLSISRVCKGAFTT